MGGVNSLIIKDLAFRFAGKSQLLKNVSLSLHKGQMTVLLGEIGSGKSILLQILQKFNHYESGEILINDTMPFADFPADEWRKIIGVVQQDVKIFNGTLLDNIILGSMLEEGEKAIAFCELMGFQKFFESLPQSYFTIVGEEGINLSGGQKQLVALARALYRQPQLLLLDEATSAMDSKTESFVLNLLQNLKSSTGILMVTHRNAIAQQADKVYRLENGITHKVKNLQSTLVELS